MQYDRSWSSCPKCHDKSPHNSLIEEFSLGFDAYSPNPALLQVHYESWCIRCDFSFKTVYEVNAMAKAKVRLKPLENRMVVKTDEAAKVSKGGIHLPGTTQEKPQRGEVLAVGPGKMMESGERMPMAVKVGDVVLFQRWAGNDVKDLGDDMLILREDEVLGIVGSE